jgi:16S rRNA processing protein RimM
VGPRVPDGLRSMTGPMVEVLVGRIGRPHGIGGEVSVAVLSDSPELRFVVGTEFVTEQDGHRGSLRLASVRPDRDRLLATFDGISDRDQARHLAGVLLLAQVDRNEPTDDPDEFHDHQLIGLSARHVDGSALGTVTDVLHMPLQDVLVVDHEGREVLVPFVQAVVPGVDLSAGAVTIDPPAGLLDDDGSD